MPEQAAPTDPTSDTTGAARIVLPADPPGPSGVAVLCARADASLIARPGDLACDAGAARQPTLGTIDTVARLALIARRRGRALRLERPTRALVELLDVSGLGEVLDRARRRAARDPPVSRAGAAGRTAETAAPCRGRT